MFKFNYKDRTIAEIYSNVAIKIFERRQWHRSDVFIANFEQMSQIILFYLFIYLFMVDYEQINADRNGLKNLPPVSLVL